jgi:chemotaxis signal transduction protein
MSGQDEARDEVSRPETVSDRGTPVATAVGEGDGTTLFVFDYADKAFALPLRCVERVIEVATVEPYPGDAPHCRGTIEFRGRVLPLFDPHGLSFGVAAPGARIFYAVIIRDSGVRFGLVLERYREFIESYPLERREAPDGVDRPVGQDQKFSVGLLSHKNRTTALLSPAAIAVAVREIFGSQSVIALDQQRDDSPIESEGRRFMVSRLGDVTIAHPVEATLEIVEGLEVSPVFGVDPCLRGLTSLRGQVLACLDVSEVLGMPPRVLDERSAYLVLSAEHAEFALCVDAVEGLRVIAPETVHPADGVLPEAVAALFPSLAECGDVTHLCLSAESIINWQRLAPYRAQE